MRRRRLSCRVGAAVAQRISWLLAGALVGLVFAGQRLAAQATASGGSALPVVRRAWPVMGTLLESTVWDADTVRAVRALHAGRVAVQRVDSLMSLYRPESELALVNRRAGTDTATVLSLETALVLDTALAYARRSDGALDVTVGPLVALWGFYRHAGRVPSAAEEDSARALVGYGKIRYDPRARTVSLPLRGMRLDFGAIAKGYALDLAVRAMRDAGATRGMVDLGGNLMVFGAPPTGAGWRVGIVDPYDPRALLGSVRLDRGAVATSGSYEQFFERRGRRYSHIFDPRTGQPARGVLSTTASAPTGIASDALSTALFVLGPEQGCALAAALPGVDAVWVRDQAPAGRTRRLGRPVRPGRAPLRAGGIVATDRGLMRLRLHDRGSPAPVGCRTAP